MLPVQLCDLWPVSGQYAHGACSVWSSASENSSKPTRSPLSGNPPKKAWFASVLLALALLCPRRLEPHSCIRPFSRTLHAPYKPALTASDGCARIAALTQTALQL